MLVTTENLLGAPAGFNEIAKAFLNPGRSPRRSHAPQHAKPKVTKVLGVWSHFAAEVYTQTQEGGEEELAASGCLETVFCDWFTLSVSSLITLGTCNFMF